MKNFIIGVLAVTTLASLAGSGLLYQRYSTSRPIVRVGNEAITKKQYEDALDYQTQGAVLKKLVYSTLVTQAATEAKVLPTEKDVDNRIADLRRRSPQALADAGQNPAKMAELRDNLKLDMALDNLRSQGVSVTNAEVADFYAKHKPLFALPAQVQTTLIVATNAVDAATAASLLRQKNMPLDVIARQKRLHVAGMNGFNPDFQSLPPAVNQNISRQVYSMKPGEVKTITFTTKADGKDVTEYLIVRANKALQPGVPALAQIKPDVVRAAKLQKALPAPMELAKLYHNANIEFEVDRYSTYFADIQSINTSGDKTASLP